MVECMLACLHLWVGWLLTDFGAVEGSCARFTLSFDLFHPLTWPVAHFGLARLRELVLVAHFSLVCCTLWFGLLHTLIWLVSGNLCSLHTLVWLVAHSV